MVHIFRDWLLQLEHLLQHTGRELEAVRPAARLAKPVYDWESATGLCMEIRELITEATSLLHKLMLRKPQPAPIVGSLRILICTILSLFSS